MLVDKTKVSMISTKDLLYNEVRRIAETNYSDPTTILHCIKCGEFLLDVILTKFEENSFFILNGKRDKCSSWARKYAHIRSSEFKKFDVVKRDPISKKRKLIASGKSFVDKFIENGLIYRNDSYSNFSKKRFSKSYTLETKYREMFLEEYEYDDLEKLEVKSLLDYYYDELAPFWYSSFHDFWKYSLGHELSNAEKRLFELSKARMPKDICSYNAKLADIWSFDIPKPKCSDVVDLDSSEYPF